MKLSIVTPTAVVVEAADVQHVRAEDASGAFGIRPGHESFLTALAVSVLSWRGADGVDHHVALRGGVLIVRDGEAVEVATRDAVPGDDLAALTASVLDVFRRRADAEAAERARTTQLRAGAIQRICRYLRDRQDSRRPLPLGSPAPETGA